MFNICRVKNISGETKTWCGQEIQPSGIHIIDDYERISWTMNDGVYVSVTGGELQIGDETGWLGTFNEQISWLKGDVANLDVDNKQLVHQTSRPLAYDTTTCFTGGGDVSGSFSSVWGGEDLYIIHASGDAMTQTTYCDFNNIENPSWIHEGYLSWQNASLDSLTVDIVPSVTPWVSGVGTSFDLYAGYLVVPSANGSIAINPSNIKFVQCVMDQNTKTMQPGYWDCDYDTSTHTFNLATLAPAPAANGAYNIFGAEIPLTRFANKIRLLNDMSILLQTSDSHQVGHGLRIRMTADTMAPDHDWKSCVTLTMHRNKTV